MTSDASLVLVVDQPDVCALLCLVLSDAGLTALPAHSAREAISLYRQHQGEISLVLLDSETEYTQTLTALLAQKPGLRYCLLDAGLSDVALSAGALRVFFKPFKMAEFVSEVRRLIGSTIR